MWTMDEMPAQCRRLARIAFDRYQREMCCQHLFLVGVKQGGVWASISVAPEALDGQQYVWPEFIPWHYTLEMLEQWVYRGMRREPVLSPA